ncbi:hypothetical protein JCM8208_001183 [Rhodotorula glutinis]
MATDRLTPLAPELLSMIFDEAYVDRPPTSPICRTLVPFLRQRLFRDIRVESFSRLDALCGLVEGVPPLGAAMRTLSINMYSDATSAQEEPQHPSDDALVRLFCALPRLERLECTGSLRMISLLRSPSVAARPDFLPSVHALSVSGLLEERVDLFQPSNLAALHHYPLRELKLYDYRMRRDPIYSPEYAPRPPLEPLPHPLPPFSGITRLSTSVCVGPAGTDQLLRLLPHLAHLALRGVSDLVGPSRFLEALPKPERLQSLELDGCGIGQWVLPDSMAGLTGLRALTIGNGADLVAPSFDSAVRSVRLDTLHFASPDVWIPFTVLERLVSTSMKHPTLKRLVLDLVHLVGNVGPPITVDNLRSWWPFTFDARAGRLPVEYWEEPMWPDEDDPVRLEDLEHLCRAGGVEVTGSAIDALRVQQACDAQRAALFEMADLVKAVDKEMSEADPEAREPRPAVATLG